MMVVVKTAKVELSWHMNSDLRSRYLWHRNENEVRKKLFCLKFSPKKFFLPKIVFKGSSQSAVSGVR